MEYENQIVCPQCNKVNPTYCNQASCPMEELFWEEDE